MVVEASIYDRFLAQLQAEGGYLANDYEGFDTALKMVQAIYDTGGKGHSCGIYSFDDDHIHLKHYMNVTWVSRPVKEDRPSPEELFGEFYNSETF